VLQQIPLELMLANPEILSSLNELVFVGVFHLFTRPGVHPSLGHALSVYCFSSVQQEEHLYRYYGDYEYIREAKLKADEREKEQFKMKFQNVPAELRQMEDVLKNCGLGTYSARTKSQNKQSSLFE